MRNLSVSEAKMKLSELVEAVSSTGEEIEITKNGSPAAVLIRLKKLKNKCTFSGEQPAGRQRSSSVLVLS